MKKIQCAIILSILGTGFCKSQTIVTDDIITLKTGEKYEGQIIEQRPGSSVTMVSNEAKDTLVFYLDQIASMKKQNRTVQNVNSSPVEERATEKKQPTLNYAQDATYQIGNDLTIFSEDEYKFKIYVNGKPYHNNFATRVALENINHNWAQISVLFENPDLGVIEQDLSLSPNDGEMLPYTSTYKIKVNKKGKLVLRYYNCSLKKVAPGSANVLIHRSTTPNNVGFRINNNFTIGR
jgi:hypothetical protein